MYNVRLLRVNHLQSRTLARTHTHLPHRSCHCWKHRRKASFGIFRSSAVAFDMMSSMVAKRVPLRPIFRVGNSQKSIGTRSGEYGGWVMTGGSVQMPRNHTSLVVQQFLAEKIIPIITQPPYSQDLAPSEFWLFPTLKMGLKGTHFATMEDIECDGRTAEDSKRSLPPVLPTMAGSMEQVCVCARVLLRRRLGKRCHMSNHYNFIPHFRELFDCPSYIHYLTLR